MKLAILDHHLHAPWPEAIRLARQLGLDGLELSVGPFADEEHPLLQAGVAGQCRQLAQEHGVELCSLSAGCCIRQGLLDANVETRRRHAGLLLRLLDCGREIGLTTMHMPLHGTSEPRTGADQRILVDVLQPVAEKAASFGITLALDAMLPAEEMRQLVELFRSPTVKVAYDAANARAAGHDAVAEVQLLAPVLAQVRVKDRERREPFASVPLGQGATDWPALIQALRRIAFTGYLVLDTPGGDNPAASTQANVEYLKRILNS